MPRRRQPNQDDAPDYGIDQEEQVYDDERLRSIIEHWRREIENLNSGSRDLVRERRNRINSNSFEEYNRVRWEQLAQQLERLNREFQPGDEDVIHDVENLMRQLEGRPMSYVSGEKLEELGKILFALIDYLGLKVELETKHKKTCTDRTCSDPTCGQEKVWHIAPKPKEFKEKQDKIDDLIITGEDEE